MAKSQFKKMSHSNKPLYGPRKILLAGFSSAEQVKFKALIKQAGLPEVPLVWLTAEHGNTLLRDLLELPEACGWGGNSDLPQAVILSGMTESAIQRLMTLNRKIRRKTILWAALTPVSETWPLSQLLHELQAERKALSQKK